MQKPAAANFVLKSFGIIMVVLFITIGTTFIFKAGEVTNFDPLSIRVIGIMLILYGIFRAYRLYRNHISGRNPNT